MEYCIPKSDFMEEKGEMSIISCNCAYVCELKLNLDKPGKIIIIPNCSQKCKYYVSIMVIDHVHSAAEKSPGEKILLLEEITKNMRVRHLMSNELSSYIPIIDAEDAKNLRLSDDIWTVLLSREKEKYELISAAMKKLMTLSPPEFHYKYFYRFANEVIREYMSAYFQSELKAHSDKFMTCDAMIKSSYIHLETAFVLKKEKYLRKGLDEERKKGMDILIANIKAINKKYANYMGDIDMPSYLYDFIRQNQYLPHKS